MTALDRFWSKVRREAGGCWTWIGAIGANGYGRFWSAGAVGVAHRFAYEQFVAPVPAGLDLDHLCRNRGCVNPARLEPVTRLENLRRGEGPAGRPTCAHGHAYTAENTYRYSDGSRLCRQCAREKQARYRKAPRVAGPCFEVDIHGEPIGSVQQ